MTPNQDRTQAAKDATQEETSKVAGEAQNAAKEVTGTAREEARQVTAEATDQIRSLASTAQDEFYSQASTQQQRLAEQSRTVSDDLQRIARGEQPESDMVNQFVSMIADRAEKFTTELETKQPADLLNDVRRFAARRPGTFLAIAAGVGLVAGRLTRGLSDSNDEQPRSGAITPRPAVPQRTTTPPPAAPLHTPVGDTPAIATGGYPAHSPGTPSVGPSDTPIGDSLGGAPTGGTGERPSNYLDDIVNRGDQR